MLKPTCWHARVLIAGVFECHCAPLPLRCQYGPDPRSLVSRSPRTTRLSYGTHVRGRIVRRRDSRARCMCARVCACECAHRDARMFVRMRASCTPTPRALRPPPASAQANARACEPRRTCVSARARRCTHARARSRRPAWSASGSRGFRLRVRRPSSRWATDARACVRWATRAHACMRACVRPMVRTRSPVDVRAVRAAADLRAAYSRRRACVRAVIDVRASSLDPLAAVRTRGGVCVSQHGLRACSSRASDHREFVRVRVCLRAAPEGRADMRACSRQLPCVRPCGWYRLKHSPGDG